jgi:hypothetical protein
MKRTAVALILAVALAPAWGQGPIQPPPYPPPNQLPPPNQAGPNQPDPNQGDAPNHGVARLSFVQGNVGMRHGDLGELTPAAVNVPLVTTDRVETGDTGRAEVQFDFNNMIRLAPSTEVRLSELDFQHFQVQIAAGSASFRVLQDTPGQVEISTPRVSVRPLKAGTYRVSVRPDGITEITVRSGQAEIDGPNGNENLAPGQTMQVRGGANGPEFQLVAAIPMDDFDRFNQDRDRVMQQASQNGSYRPGYLPPSVAGGEALDQYGQWQNDPNYGNVWVPNEPPGWAPYQNGSWIDESYYGWTWFGAEPWGWAPYHYGSWYMGSFGWAWWPGPFVGPHFWRPAMVGFFGWGPGLGIGVGFGFGFGHVGWVPLAPYEAFHPWYGAGAVAGRFGGSNVAATNAFRNARVANAVSSMNAADFGHTTVAGAGMVRPSSAELARSSAVRGGLGLAPTAASRRITSGAVNARGMPQASSTAGFYSRSSSPSAGGSANSSWRGMNGYNATGAARGSAASGQGAAAGRQVPQGNAARGGGQESANRGATPQSGYQGQSRGGSYAQPQSRPATQQQPLRMNPSIVQQRAPAPSRSGGGGHGGGGRR